jgi:hypothetical protein
MSQQILLMTLDFENVWYATTQISFRINLTTTVVAGCTVNPNGVMVCGDPKIFCWHIHIHNTHTYRKI